MKSNVSVKDIASELNVSLSTVHKALTGKPGISEERRKQVLEVAKRLGYEVNKVAQSLARKEIRLGIVTTEKYRYDPLSIHEGMAEELRNLKKHKVYASFFNMLNLTEKTVEELFEWLGSGNIDALIFCPSVQIPYNDFLPILDDITIPLFFAGEEYLRAHSVTDIAVDNHKAAKLAADFLRCIEGNKLRAAIFSGSIRHKEYKEKRSEFIRRVERAGGVVEYIFEVEDNPQKIYEYMESIRDKDINAIYVNSSVFLPICRYIEEHHLQEQYSVVCTDITEGTKEYMQKGIIKATISQRRKEVGKVAVRTAYEYFVKKNSYGNEDIQVEPIIWIQPKLLLLADVE